jgi:hypothetical protein
MTMWGETHWRESHMEYLVEKLHALGVGMFSGERMKSGVGTLRLGGKQKGPTGIPDRLMLSQKVRQS